MSKVSDITDSKWLGAKTTATEWLAVIISGIAVGISLISMFVAAIAIGIVSAQNGRIEELSDEIGVMRVYITNHKGKHEDE